MQNKSLRQRGAIYPVGGWGGGNVRPERGAGAYRPPSPCFQPMLYLYGPGPRPGARYLGPGPGRGYIYPIAAGGREQRFGTNVQLENTFKNWKQRVGMDLDCPAVAIGVWGDSARYFTRDQLYLLLFNVISGKNHKRYWVAAWSKRTQCDCGCKGRCTLEGIMAVFVWSIGCLVRGKFPWVRHDNVPFAESDKAGDKKRAQKVSDRKHPGQENSG